MAIYKIKIKRIYQIWKKVTNINMIDLLSIQLKISKYALITIVHKVKEYVLKNIL